MDSVSVLLQQASPATLGSALAVCAAAALAGVVVLGLRLARRGPARFWLAPAFTTLTLVPLASGTALWAAGIGRTAEAAALLGASSTGATRAGLAEAVLSLLVGTLATFGLAIQAFLLLAVGRRREAAAASSATATFATTAVLLCLATLALVAGTLVAAGAPEASYAPGLARVLEWTGGALTLVLFVAAFPLALKAPRGPAPQVARVLSLGAPAAIAGAALVGAAASTVFVVSVLSALQSLSNSTAAMEPPLPATSPWPTPTHGAPPVTKSEASSPGPATPARVGSDVPEPRKLLHVPPRYPDLARQARVQGKVVLDCLIGPDGRVKEIEVKRGAPLLDEAAREAVRQWVYEPTLLNGVAVPVRMTVTVKFELR